MARDGSVGVEARAIGRKVGPGVKPGVTAADMAGLRIVGVAVGADRRIDGVVVVVVLGVVALAVAILAYGLHGIRPGMGVASGGGGGGMAEPAGTMAVVVFGVVVVAAAAAVSDVGMIST
jgi:hypothetical protein